MAPGSKRRRKAAVALVTSAPADCGEGATRDGGVASGSGEAEADADASSEMPSEMDLKELLDAGLLSRGEYDAKKAEIVGRHPGPARF